MATSLLRDCWKPAVLLKGRSYMYGLEDGELPDLPGGCHSERVRRPERPCGAFSPDLVMFLRPMWRRGSMKMDDR